MTASTSISSEGDSPENATNGKANTNILSDGDQAVSAEKPGKAYTKDVEEAKDKEGDGPGFKAYLVSLYNIQKKKKLCD
jgi:hypothetical protein